MYDGFVERAQSVERLLHDRRTTFAVVTTLEAAPLYEAENFCAVLREREFHLGALVLNKTLPDSLLDPDGARGRRRRSATRPGPLADALAGARRSRARRPGAHRAGAADDRRVVRQLLGGRDARGRAARRARPGARRRRPGAGLRARHQRRRVAARDLRRALHGGVVTICEHPRRSGPAAHEARRAPTSSTSSASWPAGARSPTSRSPTSCCSRRSRARRGTGSWCSPRCGR